ncbi:unnamed protein product [Paramecium primaurelia]|uniref:Zinc finger ZPR1-type domain-containing protein n=1 Tax=Paramecium primaurelia TaxID=5886 RepID=A0A8S1KWE9_PARPR|nr:unnamed protein product [Paramecium primaurelia]
MNNPEVIYANLTGDSEPFVTDSLCVNCEKQGKTTILLTKIPMFSNIIIVSFDCEHCGYKNNEVQFGGEIKEKGIKLHLKVNEPKDLQRQIIRSEFCKVLIPELEFEMPSNKKSSINTLEGFLQNIIDDLSHDQPIRKFTQVEVYDRIEYIIGKLKEFKEGQGLPFNWMLEDPSGNSFIQNLNELQDDPSLKIQHYIRTIEELEAMGYSAENQKQEVQQLQQQQQIIADPIHQGTEQIQAGGQNFNQSIEDSVKNESINIPTPCNVCKEMGENKMCTVTIPHFKEILIMSFNCGFCGFKDTEVKATGEISKQGKIIELKFENEKDLCRDVFKSDTAKLIIPEIELELGTGTLGGVYSNVEGLLEQILTRLRDNNPFVGDSADDNYRKKMESFFQKLEEFKSGKSKFTLIIRDLVENSFIQNPYYPNEDTQVKITLFDRTPEDNDELGIDTMKTENYQN